MSLSDNDEYELPNWNRKRGPPRGQSRARSRARSRKSDASAIDKQYLITHSARSKAARRAHRKISRSVSPSRTIYNCKHINDQSKDDELSQHSDEPHSDEPHSDNPQQLPLQKNSTDEVIANAKDQNVYISQPCFVNNGVAADAVAGAVAERIEWLEKELQAIKKSAEVSAIQSNEVQDQQFQIQIPFVDNSSSSEELENVSVKSSRDSSKESSKESYDNLKNKVSAKSSKESSKESSRDSSKESSDNSDDECLKKIPQKPLKKSKKHRKGSTSSDSTSNYSSDSMTAKEIRSETEKIRKSVPSEKLTNAIKSYIYDRLDVYNIKPEDGLSEQMHIYNTSHKLRILTDVDLIYIIAMVFKRTSELGTGFITIEYEDSNNENGYSCILCGCIPIGKPEVKRNTIR